MRTLLLLRGVPGAGKSTFIREHHLEPYTLCADDFRLKISNPVLNASGKFCISQEHDNEAWALLYDALEKRMRRGDFTVIDATNISPKMLPHYKKLLDQYRYSAFYLNIDVSLEEALRRNAAREEYKRVPEPDVRRMFAMYQNLKVPSYVKPIQSLDEILNYFVTDLGNFQRVQVIGDVHGCYTALKALLTDGGLDSDTKYIFVGDMLERGIQNQQVLDFILRHAKDKNVTFVMGNHDQRMLDWATGNLVPDKKGRIHLSSSFRKCVDELMDGLDPKAINQRMKDIRDAFRRFVQAYAFTFGGKKYFVCHGGISALPSMTLISAQQLTWGVGDYSLDIDNLYENSYALSRTQGFIQIHGHRCREELDAEIYNGTEHSISLEGHVERGGSLKSVILWDTGERQFFRVKNTVFDPHLGDSDEQIELAAADSKKIVTESPTTNAMITDPDIRVKEQKDHNLLSLNFTDKAFYGHRWNERTIQARGLFVDTESGEVRLRSYNKFFNLYERPETKPDALSRSLAFPLSVYRKQNGFLGILSVVDGDVVLATKSQTSGQYVDYFREIYATLADEEKDALKRLSIEYSCSFVFEVCHVKDRHIIDFDKNHLWLLDAIPNAYEIGGKDINKAFSDEVKGKVPIVSSIMQKKVLLFTADSVQEVIDYAKAHHHDRDIEGVVCQDAHGYMFKLKFHYYTTMKKLRAAFLLAQRKFSVGIPWGAFRDERTIKFIAFFTKLPYAEWRNLHIIDAIKWYERENGVLMEKEN